MAVQNERPAHGIGVVVVNYATDPDVLARTIGAALASTGVGPGTSVPLIEILIVDNDSPRHRDEARAAVLALAPPDGPTVRWHDLARNTGFAGGVNAALALLDPRCSLVFLLNPDARVEPTVLARCADVLAGLPASWVAAAPKMVLDRTAHQGDPLDAPLDSALETPLDTVLDSVGHAINERGEAFNVGLGQPDLGQYDVAAPCFGPCFGAAMIRRSAFANDQVGPLDEHLFLYYEDVDWNWRAQALGFDAVTVPDARVHHLMSITMRDRPYGDKFTLTERNLLICALKNFDGSHAWLVVGRRLLGLAKGSLTGRHYPLPGLRAIGGFVQQLPSTLRARRALQHRRARGDQEVLRFGRGEQTFFDAVRYEPIEREAAAAFARERLQRVGVSPPA